MAEDKGAQTIERIHELLKEDTEMVYNYHGERTSAVEVTPIKGEDCIFLIFNGWQLVLKSDGTYYWEDPSG
jgi:hypothetical protein